MSSLVGCVRSAVKRSLFAISTIGITGVAVFLLYRSTQLTGESVHNAFFSGLILLSCVAVRVKVRWSRREMRMRRGLEAEMHSLRRTVADQRRKLESIRLEVEKLTAAEMFLRAPTGSEGSAGERSFRVISDR
jgi:hypothetical protein